MKPQTQFRVRIFRDDCIAIGPGKVELLEGIAATGSISAAARRMDMSYRRAWQLVDQMNSCLLEPAVATAKGGLRGGGAALTPTGERIVQHYRAMEAAAHVAADTEIAALLRLLAR